MSEKDGFEISRRKALAGLGVVGVASAGAGLGTTAYFSDQEEFEGNTITAGEFGLTVDPYNYEVLQDEESQHFPWNAEYGGDDDPGAFIGGTIDIDDAKPGDHFKFCWKITVHDNPGYVLARVDPNTVKDLDGSQTGAKLHPDDLHDTDSLATLGETASAEVKVYPPSASGNPMLTKQYDTLSDLLDTLKDGLVIGNDGPLSIGPRDTVASYTHVIVCVYIWIGEKSGIVKPRIDGSGVGNKIQGAEVSANLEFYAEQSRHNDEFGES